MKKILYVIATALLLATGCQKDNARLAEQIVGEWHYSATEQGVAEDVYIGFSADGTFEMYQKVGDGVHWYIAGEYAVDAAKGILSGVYSDRYPWKYDYRIAFQGNTLVMTAVQLETYSVTYTKGPIPADVREKSLPLTRSESVVLFL